MRRCIKCGTYLEGDAKNEPCGMCAARRSRVNAAEQKMKYNLLNESDRALKNNEPIPAAYFLIQYIAHSEAVANGTLKQYAREVAACMDGCATVTSISTLPSTGASEDGVLTETGLAGSLG